MGGFNKDMHLWMQEDLYDSVKELCENHLGGMAVSAFMRLAIAEKLASERRRIAKMGLESQ